MIAAALRAATVVVVQEIARRRGDASTVEPRHAATGAVSTSDENFAAIELERLIETNKYGIDLDHVSIAVVVIEKTAVGLEQVQFAYTRPLDELFQKFPDWAQAMWGPSQLTKH